MGLAPESPVRQWAEARKGAGSIVSTMVLMWVAAIAVCSLIVG